MLSKLIWGSLLIALGISFIVKAFWGFDIPILKPLLGLFFIYLGYTIIIAPSVINLSCQTKHNGEITQNIREATHEYNILFSKQTIDISQIKLVPEKNIKIKINVMMGSAVVITNPTIPTRFTVSTMLASADLPNMSVAPAGNATYQTHNTEVEPIVEIYLNVLLGSVAIKPERR